MSAARTPPAWPLSPGLVGQAEHAVAAADTIASRVDSRLPPVLATFVLVEWMEVLAGRTVQPLLSPGHISLGVHLDIEQRGMAGIGRVVHLEARLVEAGHRRLDFEILASAGDEVLALATHRRHVIDRRVVERQLERRRR